MHSRPSQRQIDAFIEIVKQGSLVAAARKLGFTQPALSRRLTELEAQLGVPLMARSRSGVTLTFGDLEETDQTSPSEPPDIVLCPSLPFPGP